MKNTFTAAAANQAGISYTALSKAASCCVVRHARGIYTVTKVCARHPDLSRFADDEALLDLARKWRISKRTAPEARFWRAVHAGLIWNSSSIRPDDVVSHESAALVHRLPTVISHLPRVILSNPTTSRTKASVRRHKLAIPQEHTVPWGHVTVSSQLRTVLDLAVDVGIEDAVMATDKLLFEAMDTHARLDALAEMADSSRRLSSSRQLRCCLAWANGLAESPAESLARVRFCEWGLRNAVQQQVAVHDESGAFIARVDFMLDAAVLKEGGGDSITGLVVEVDGEVKYADRSSGGFASTESDTLVEEKKRQYALERLGYRVVRFMWADLISPRRFAIRLREAGIVL